MWEVLDNDILSIFLTALVLLGAGMLIKNLKEKKEAQTKGNPNNDFKRKK